MKKKVFIILSVCFLVLSAALFAFGIYINANIEEITREYLGAGIQFEDVEFSFTPMPAISFSNLKIEKDKNKVEIPSLVLYPDLQALIKGNIVVKKAVVMEPLILSEKILPSDRENQASILLSVLLTNKIMTNKIMIREIMVHDGKLVMYSGDATAPPVTFAVSANNIQKKDQTISIQVKNFTIDEIGLNFAGDIAITSFSPLGLKVNASKAVINPAALKNFLVEFEFLKTSVGDQIPKIEQVEAVGLKLSIDQTTGNMDIVSESLGFGQNQFRNIAVNLSKKGGYDLKCEKVMMDIGTVQGWLNENPKGKDALKQLFVKAGLKDLRAAGKVELSAIDLNGGGEQGAKINGAMDLKSKGLKIHLVAQNGKEQNFTINCLDAQVTIREGKPLLQVSNLQAASSRGGTGLLKGELEIPLKLENAWFEATLNSFQVFDTALNLKAVKKLGEKLTFDMDVSGPSLTVLARGQLQTPGREKADFRIWITECRISRGTTGKKAVVQGKAGRTDKKDKGSGQDFDFSAIRGKTLSCEVFVKIFQYNDLPQLNDVHFTLACKNDQAVVRGSSEVCLVDLFVNAVFMPTGRVTAQVEGKSSNMNLTSFLACFSRELPLFLTGKVSVVASLFADGRNRETLLDSAQGDLMITLKNCTVCKVSSLDYRLNFLVDMLNAAGITSLKDDAVYFQKGLAMADILNGRVILDQFSLTGPLMSAWGSGEFSLKKKHLKIAGRVQTAFGIANDLQIDRILEKRKT